VGSRLLFLLWPGTLRAAYCVEQENVEIDCHAGGDLIAPRIRRSCSSRVNLTITSANVTKVISIATAIYWALAGLVLWSDLRSGDWLQKGGGWIGLVLLTGLCGTGFWLMLTPMAIRAFKANRHPFTTKKLAKAFWCLSTIPAVLLCLWFFLLLVCYRITES
jgi:hypothetical protein